MESASYESNEWLMRQKWVKGNSLNIEKVFTLKDRLLFRSDNFFFGIKFDNDYPRTRAVFFNDWKGECNTKPSCYIQEKMKGKHKIKDILSSFSFQLPYLLRITEKQREINRQLEGDYNEDLEELEYLSDEEAEDIENMEELDLRKNIEGDEFFEGAILQNIVMMENDVGVYLREDGIYEISIGNNLFHLDISTFREGKPKLWIIKPYYDNSNILESGLVLLYSINQLTKKNILNLGQRLVSFVNLLDFGSERDYNIELLETHYRLLYENTDSIAKTEYRSSTIELTRYDSQFYSCDIPESLFNKAVELNTFSVVELVNKFGIRTYCSVGSPIRENRLRASRKVLENLRLLGEEDPIVKYRLVVPGILKDIVFQDVETGYFDHMDHKSYIREELEKYQVVTTGTIFRTLIGDVAIKEINPSPCAATVKYLPGVTEANVTYLKAETKNSYPSGYSPGPLGIDYSQYSDFSESFTG